MFIKPRVKIDFTRVKKAAFSPEVHKIINLLTTNAATFPALPVTVVTLLGQIGVYDGIIGKPYYRGQKNALKAARKVVERTLKVNGIYVNGVGDGVVDILVKSGYPISKPHYPSGPLEKSKLRATSIESGFDCEISKVDHAKNYFVLYMEANAGTVEQDYHKWHWAYLPKRRGRVTGLKPATTYIMVSVALGTNPQLTFSDPIRRTTQ